MKGVGRSRTQLLDDLRNRRRYWELKEEAADRKRLKLQFINRTYGTNTYLPKSTDLIIRSILNNSNNLNCS